MDKIESNLDMKLLTKLKQFSEIDEEIANSQSSEQKQYKELKNKGGKNNQESLKTATLNDSSKNTKQIERQNSKNFKINNKKLKNEEAKFNNYHGSFNDYMANVDKQRNQFESQKSKYGVGYTTYDSNNIPVYDSKFQNSAYNSRPKSGNMDSTLDNNINKTFNYNKINQEYQNYSNKMNYYNDVEGEKFIDNNNLNISSHQYNRTGDGRENKSQKSFLSKDSLKTEYLENYPNYISLKAKINKINKSRSKSKNNNDAYMSSNKSDKVYVSLYENFKRIKGKLENKKVETDYCMKKAMSPSITTKARNIIRDPNNFQERLYPYHKIEGGDGYQLKQYPLPKNLDEKFKKNAYLFKVLDENDVYDIYGNKINHDNIYRRSISPHLRYDDRSKFSFNPSFNKNSLKIAERLEPSFERLTRDKSKTSCNSKGNSILSSPLNLSRDRKAQTNVNSGINSPGRQLYEKGMKNLKKKVLNYEVKCQELQQKYREYTFKPNILPSSREYLNNRSRSRENNTSVNRINDINKINSNSKSPRERKIGSPHSFIKSEENKDKNNIKKLEDMYKRNQSWKMYIEEKIEKEREKKEIFNNEKCTFSPDISHKKISNDEKMIMRNIPSMINYINKRRQNISKEKELKVLRERKPSSGKLVPKITVPTNVYFEMDKRIEERKGLKKSKSKNYTSINLVRKECGADSFYINPENNDKGNFTLGGDGTSFSNDLKNQGKKLVNAVTILNKSLNSFKV